MLKYRQLVTLVLIVIISACTTTQSSYTTSGRSSIEGEINLNKAMKNRLNMGMRYLALGNYERAKFNLDKAYSFVSNNEDVLRAFAWYYEKVSETELAEEYYKKALKINNKNPDLLTQYGVFLCINDRLDESLKMFEASAKILSNKDVSGTYENAGTCNLMAGNTEQATVFFRKALNHNPRLWASLLGMASIEYDKGRYNRSHSYISRFEDISKHNARSLWLALRTESNLGNMDGVASYGLRLEQMFPDSQETADYLDTRDRWLN